VGERNGEGAGRGSSPRFASILFTGVDRPPTLPTEPPPFFADLRLDRLVDEIAKDWPGYDLAPFFYAALHDEDAVRYRQEVFRDLEDEGILRAITAFTEQMRAMRRSLEVAEQSHYRHERERWLLDAAGIYRDATIALGAELSELPVGSRGLRELHRYLLAYTDSEAFVAFASESRAVAEALAGVRYQLHIRGLSVVVNEFEGESDFSQDVLTAFARFQGGAVTDYRRTISTGQLLDHVEARILELVARRFPGPFGALDRFAERYPEFRDPVIRRFDREVHFYLAYRRVIDPLRGAGLSFCSPRCDRDADAIFASDAFDLVLARKLCDEGRTVIPNDFSLSGGERIFVVTGPNQGGKTTFARMVGQLHHLGSLGCPVPGSAAQLLLPDRIFAHFEREEDISTLRGKLEDELVRVRDILGAATSRSVVVMNESFSSTTLDDSRFLGREVLGRLSALGAVGVYVTFVDELASLNEVVVSMVGQVDPADPAIRTFKILRMPADGLAYARAIAAKHGLDPSTLRQRIGP
jgi:DNA mismatch repair protein MutS